MNKDKAYIEVLKQNRAVLQSSMDSLGISVNKCRSILQKKDYSFEELESFDSLTSKFARTSDIYTQKILRGIWIILHEPFIAFIDMANKAEKIRIIKFLRKVENTMNSKLSNINLSKQQLHQELITKNRKVQLLRQISLTKSE